jgi:FtsP/CotA-like multicopper oxidase with cupredoxin domain
MYPFRDVGFVDGPITRDERPSFYWFHDHILDFTGPNVYRGLANFAPAFDDLDTGREDTGLGLPSGDHDVPLLIQDKLFDASGLLIFDPFDGDGFLGDRMVVNGVVQPYPVIERRKYRLRFLNGSNARIYQMFLTDAAGRSYPMTQIATEGGLLAKPIPNVRSFELYLAQRVEVIVDFADPMFNQIAASGQPFLYVENRMRQDDGRKPDGVQNQGTKLLQFRLEGGPVSTPPVPGTLRPFAPISDAELAAAERRSFKFDRSGGVFTINGEPVDIDREDPVRRNVGQLWHFENDSGGWWHPNHVHSEFMRVIRRNGQPPPLNEADGMARKDAVVMRQNENVDVYIKFRDFSGPFVAHCHNMEHEDHAMMMRFDVE